MKQLYLQAQPAALVDEVVGVGEQFMQNLEGLLQKLELPYRILRL